MVRHRKALCLLLLTGLALSPARGRGAARTATPATVPGHPPKLVFEKDVKPLLAQYCYGCHGEKKKGGLDLRIYGDEQTAARDRQVFEKVARNLNVHEMPPENKPQPEPEERDRIMNWVASFFSQCDCDHPDPGRITLRRLNRAEYNNTIRDLVGVNFQPAEDFPADDSGYGFDNIGDVLSLSPLLLEKYLAAAEKILDAVIPTVAATNETGTITIPMSADAYGRIFICRPMAGNERDCARQIITAFARRAFRRPITAQEQERFMGFFESALAEEKDFDKSIKLALETVLVSPRFLFRGVWPADPQPQAVHLVDEYDLASRLSYFLWSSMPDEALFARAERGTLRRNLESEIRRLLKDPKAHALVENFAGQWLQLRNLKLATPDPKEFPEFDGALRAAMQEETEQFFENILRENRSVLEFLDSDYTFLNERLARLYGVSSVTGEQFRRVKLKNSSRGGLLTQASILTITSNPTRTSPVKRGKWVLENILGTPPPPPPPNVPELKEGKAALTGTLRQRMEQHRADPNCATCHARMDPIGFGFENFNAIGVWRDRDGDFPIDPAGQLSSGEAFEGPAGLKTILLQQKRDAFVHCLTEKLLTYALGRGLEYYDKCAVDRITARLAKSHYKFGTLIVEVARSTPFQMTRGEQPPPTLAKGER